ncbi:hypothetical protein C8024_04750 [Sphingopyxis sp. BSNA05]|uniref:hypothetical protein n=1 Tax=Sphingopyxis sp. BSNA05 TaxID=1236614 RepID=UPI0015679287|nr:hypothetical protein [Sphingopyxis sp. BSNA05]NRD88915.1 hypothetical protein [Sphingopyxis sp. BSNA05]
MDDALQPQYTLSAGERRSMTEIGVLTPQYNGLPKDAFGQEGGQYLTNLIRNLHGPIISRWGSILLRRTLLSKVVSPENVNPADWAAERAWRLLLMGEADAARSLVLKVDGGNYTPRLYEVAMQAHLATADPAGICPLVDGGLGSAMRRLGSCSGRYALLSPGSRAVRPAFCNRQGATRLRQVLIICLLKRQLVPGSKVGAL